MKQASIWKNYWVPLMLHILLAALITGAARKHGIETGYGSLPGVLLIVFSGISSAAWGILYQCRQNHRRFSQILRDIAGVRQSPASYLLALLFLLLDFGGVILSGGFPSDTLPLLLPLFLQALIFGGIEELGWRYTFQPALERRVGYVPAVLLTFLSWGIWHFLFFYIDGSLISVHIPFFLAGLLTNCFILSALYAYSGSLWLCIMTHALINALSQMAVDGNAPLNIFCKVVCITFAVGLHNMILRKEEAT